MELTQGSFENHGCGLLRSTNSAITEGALGAFALQRTLGKYCSSYQGTLEALDKGICFLLWKYRPALVLACSAFKQKYCRHLGCFLCLLKTQVLLSLSSNSDSVCYGNELRRCADLGSLTVNKERPGPFLRT